MREKKGQEWFHGLTRFSGDTMVIHFDHPFKGEFYPIITLLYFSIIRLVRGNWTGHDYSSRSIPRYYDLYLI